MLDMDDVGTRLYVGKERLWRHRPELPGTACRWTCPTEYLGVGENGEYPLAWAELRRSLGIDYHGERERQAGNRHN